MVPFIRFGYFVSLFEGYFELFQHNNEKSAMYPSLTLPSTSFSIDFFNTLGFCTCEAAFIRRFCQLK
jgi:hypothetical protein